MCVLAHVHSTKQLCFCKQEGSQKYKGGRWQALTFLNACPDFSLHVFPMNRFFLFGVRIEHLENVKRLFPEPLGDISSDSHHL